MSAVRKRADLDPSVVVKPEIVGRPAGAVRILAPEGVASPFAFRNRLVFSYQDETAVRVELHGDFRGWKTTVASLEPLGGGLWRTSLETPLPGRYRYKFVVDGDRWTEDPSHDLKEPDGFGGFNSLVHVGWDVR